MNVEMENITEKYKVDLIHILNYYSKYYCRQLYECESLFQSDSGHTSIFYLFSLLENIIKSTLNNYDETTYKLIQKLKENNVINEIECDFLNGSEKGVRKIRNIFAHANLSKYDFKIGTESITYPFTENETCLLLYSYFSNIICGLIIKILNPMMEIQEDIDLSSLIEGLNYQIIERTPEELLNFKGINPENILGWDELDESTKFRLVENSPDTNILSMILGNLNK